MVRQYSLNHLGGFSSTDTKLDFIGKPLSVITKRKKEVSNTAALEIRENFTYTDQERLLTHTHRIGSGITQLLANNNYDELGQLIKKDVGGLDISGAASLQKVDYSYNIRGWLKSINDVNELTPSTDPTDLFAFKIDYDHIENDFGNEVKALYNGNISQTYWKTDSDNVKRSYGYKYDNLNRLLKALYQRGTEVTHSYDEILNYDKNGNITDLTRNGYMDSPSYGTVYPIDDLIYGYSNNSNKLLSVYDESQSIDGFKDGNPDGTDYRYDEFGNMIEDKNKKIDKIFYNHLNLPVKIEFNTGGQNEIKYLYNAVGVKLGKIVTSTTPQTGTEVHTTDYLSGFQYKNNVLEFFPTAEGYVSVINGDKFNYVYNYTDHLGNIRVSYTKDPSDGEVKILEENHYYPFGLKHSNYNVDTAYLTKGPDGISVIIRPTDRSEYQYKYQGQERQDELSLNWDSFKWRNYDYAIGRFMSIDPLAEKYAYQSPYNFAENKVIDHIELEGLEGLHHTIVDKAGNTSHIIEKNIVFLRQIPQTVPENATPKEAEKIINKNRDIAASETYKFNTIKSELEVKFGGDHQNSDGENVTFEFNYSEIAVDNTNVEKTINGLRIHQFGYSMGLEGADGKTAPAALITSDLVQGTKGGNTIGPKVFQNSSSAPYGTWAHEILHTLGLPDNGYNKGGLLNNPPQGLIETEVNQIIEESIPAKN